MALHDLESESEVETLVDLEEASDREEEEHPRLDQLRGVWVQPASSASSGPRPPPGPPPVRRPRSPPGPPPVRRPRSPPGPPPKAKAKVCVRITRDNPLLRASGSGAASSSTPARSDVVAVSSETINLVPHSSQPIGPLPSGSEVCHYPLDSRLPSHARRAVLSFASSSTL